MWGSVDVGGLISKDLTTYALHSRNYAMQFAICSAGIRLMIRRRGVGCACVISQVAGRMEWEGIAPSRDIDSTGLGKAERKPEVRRGK